MWGLINLNACNGINNGSNYLLEIKCMCLNAVMMNARAIFFSQEMHYFLIEAYLPT